jgi:hypothetical protein
MRQSRRLHGCVNFRPRVAVFVYPENEIQRKNRRKVHYSIMGSIFWTKLWMLLLNVDIGECGIDVCKEMTRILVTIQDHLGFVNGKSGPVA